MLQTAGDVLKKLKIKPLTKEQIIISMDRLTRFKAPDVKYLRVFSDVLTSNLILPKLKKSEIERMDYAEVTTLAEFVFNYSIKAAGLAFDDDYLINQRLLDYEKSIFQVNSNVEAFLKNKINYKAALNLLREEALPLNLKWLKSLSYSTEPIQERVEKSLLYPLEKVFICEGITEETLLPVFAKLLGYDFEKNGIYVLSAGGKNQVVKTFYRLVDILKIPIFVLLDNDAGENYNEILPRLRSIDKVHVLKIGEFEDALPPHLVERTLAYATRNISLAPHDDITSAASRVEYLENFFKHRGLHEFKKSEFANMVKNNILDFSDVSDEIKEVVEELRTLNANCENISSG